MYVCMYMYIYIYIYIYMYTYVVCWPSLARGGNGCSLRVRELEPDGRGAASQSQGGLFENFVHGGEYPHEAAGRVLLAP